MEKISKKTTEVRSSLGKCLDETKKAPTLITRSNEVFFLLDEVQIQSLVSDSLTIKLRSEEGIYFGETFLAEKIIGYGESREDVVTEIEEKIISQCYSLHEKNESSHPRFLWALLAIAAVERSEGSLKGLVVIEE